jgi:adenosine kinase
VFAGCVGEDKYAEILKEKAKETGLRTMFQTTEKCPTATCAVLLTSHGQNRSLVCHLNAANHFTHDFLDRDNNWSVIENIRLFYITVGFDIESSLLLQIR